MAEYVIENITSDNNLTLSADNEILVSKTPISDFGIATKKYVDDNIADIDGQSLGTGENIFTGKIGNKLQFRSLSISGLLSITSNTGNIILNTNPNITTLNNSQNLTNKTLTDPTNDISANKLRSSSGDINISGNTPLAGQVLVAQSSNNALWQNPSGTSSQYFNAINQKITTKINNSWTLFEFDNVIISDLPYTFLNSTQIRINETGNYIVQIDSSLIGISGSQSTQSRSHAEIRLILNKIEVFGTRRLHYIRTNTFGDSSSINRYISLNSGDILSIQGIKILGNSDISTKQNGCSFLIRKV